MYELCYVAICSVAGPTTGCPGAAMQPSKRMCCSLKCAIVSFFLDGKVLDSLPFMDVERSWMKYEKQGAP